MKQIVNKSKKMLEIEHNKGVMIEEELRRMYVDESKSIEEIQTLLSISYVTVLKWLGQAGIYSKKLDI